MATLEEILAQVGLSDTSSGQTKTAAAAAPSTSEVNKVLEDLGLSGGVESIDKAGIAKTASEERNHMNFTELYESMFGEEVAPAADEAGQEKVAAAAAPVAAAAAAATEVENTEGEEGPTDALGQLTGIYVNVLEEAMTEKLAGDLEHEAGAGSKPQAHAPAGGELSRIVGKEGDPSIAMNHNASSGAGLKVNPGNQTPYSLKARAQIKAILKRNMKSESGDIGGYHE